MRTWKAVVSTLVLFSLVPVGVFSDSEQKGTKLSLPARKKNSFFAEIDQSILALLENGSPSSLIKILSSLRKSNGQYSDAERGILFIASGILRTCFSSEYKPEYLVTSPKDLSKNVYVGALEFALEGVYDYAAGSADFLSLVLPSVSFCVSQTPDADSFSVAEQSLSEALKIKKNSVLANYLMGKVLFIQKKYAEATSFFDTAHELAPDVFELSFDFASSLFYDGKIDRADAMARSLFASIPQENDIQRRNALKLCAETAFTVGDFDSAETYVARILQQESSSSYYLLFRVKILMSKGDYIRAASLLDVYSRTDSSSRDYLLLRSKIQRDWNKNYALALSTIERAVSLYGNDTDVLLEAARLASENGGTVSGMTAGELASLVLQKDGENKNARLILVKSLSGEKKWSEAYSLGKSLLEEEGSGASDDLLFSFIEIALHFGKKDEAWKIASKLYNERSDDEGVIQAYLSVLIETGRKSDAQKIIEKLLPKSSAKLKSFLYYQRSFLVSGEDALLSDLRSSLTANPRNRDALFRLYEIYFSKKEYRKAQYYLKQVVALSPSDETLISLNANLDSLLRK